MINIISKKSLLVINTYVLYLTLSKIGSLMQKNLHFYLFSFGFSLLMIGGCVSTSNPQISEDSISTSASIASTPKNTDKPKANNYPEAFIKEYIDGCVSTITNMKTEDEKKAACTCLINKAQELYTIEEFIKVSQELNMEKQTPPKVFEIIISCLKK